MIVYIFPKNVYNVVKNEHTSLNPLLYTLYQNQMDHFWDGLLI